MELHENGFLEELLAFRKEIWESYPSNEISGGFCSNGGSYDYFQENPGLLLPYTSFGFPEQGQPVFTTSSFNEACYTFNDGVSSVNEMEAAYQKPDTSNVSLPCKEDCITPIDDEELGLLCENIYNSENPKIGDMEMTPSAEIIAFHVGPCGERKNRVRRLEGQPSKNLMAERRRRKRLNDRLSMLRSVVPKISKMDRTSILGDTIDYMKELLERIKKLQEEIQEGSSQLNVASIFRDLKPNEILVRNTPKFDVERRITDTRIEVSCAAKPGLLLSTVNTLEALGLEIQQCVISCFNDFGLQASCSEDLEHRALLNSEEIKQALFRNAGYGGRCM